MLNKDLNYKCLHEMQKIAVERNHVSKKLGIVAKIKDILRSRTTVIITSQWNRPNPEPH